MPHQTEPSANNALGGLLHGMPSRRQVLSENTQTIAGNPGLRPDILITAAGCSPVVVESEYMPAAHAEAEAKSRLGLEAVSGRVIEAAIALRYPEEVGDADDLRTALEGARLSYCAFTEEAGGVSRFPQSGWLDGTTEDLSDLVRLVSLPQRAVDEATTTLQEGIAGAAKHLDEVNDSRPPYMRRSRKVAEVLPILYLRGLSTGDFREALPVLLGEDAAGLSATNIARLTGEWEQEYQQFRRRDLSERDYVYVWVDAIHFNIRLEDDRLCTLVMIGARPDGTKELIALEDGYRESTESWASLLRDLQRQGMRAPVVAVGDGALGFWAAVRDVWPETKEQRDWCHKMGNVLDKLPKRLQPKAKRALREMMYAETREQADEHIDRFITDYQAKYPKAAECLDKDRAALTRHYDFPAEHWKHLRTTNVIESPFATVRLRQRVTKGAGSRTNGLLLTYKLLDMAQQRWRRINGADKLPLVRAGVTFVDGIQQEREANEDEDRKDAA